MSEEKTQVQNARKDLDILNKMKNLPGGLVIIPLVIAVVLATFVPRTRRIPRNRTICINCNNYKLKRITVHFPFFTVRKCNRYRSYLNPVTE